ncbi:winged helix DNA-binding domain-containing protein [Nonomuraea sp. NPDC049152]|uniref:winged helix DNA-binding domain-containing protein n=1 Tax=Nonomuraea sp. NPDC049152 TaxID=3154350 RepID=UPI0033F29CBE
MRMSTAQRRARLGVRHLLAEQGGSVEEAAEAVVALHGTDPATVFLSAAARAGSKGPEPMERALYEDRTLVRMTGMRRTIFVVPRALAPVVHHSSALAVAVKERKLLTRHFEEGGGFDGEWISRVEGKVLEALRLHGEATAATLGTLVPELREQLVYAAGKPYEARQGVGTRLLFLMAAEGLIVRQGRPSGSWISGQHRWALAPEMPLMAVRDARAELVRRWLAAYGPGTEADLKWWTGWSLGDVRKALAAVGATEVELEDGPAGYVLPGDVEADEPEPWAAFLPALDPTPMGWQQRDWYLPQAHRAELFDRSGNVGPTVWWNGAVVGGWGQRADGEVVWRLLEDVGSDARQAVERAAEGVTAWLDGVTVTPRFRTPLERALR